MPCAPFVKLLVTWLRDVARAAPRMPMPRPGTRRRSPRALTEHATATARSAAPDSLDPRHAACATTWVGPVVFDQEEEEEEEKRKEKKERGKNKRRRTRRRTRRRRTGRRRTRRRRSSLSHTISLRRDARGVVRCHRGESEGEASGAASDVLRRERRHLRLGRGQAVRASGGVGRRCGGHPPPGNKRCGRCVGAPGFESPKQ